MRRNGYLCTSGVNLDTAIQFADPDFLLSAKFRRFRNVLHRFLHLIFWMSAIFLLPVCLTYWPRKFTTRVDPHVDNSHQVWVDMTIHCRVIAFLSADTSRNFVTLTFDLLTLNSCCAWRFTWSTNHATKSEIPTPISSWFMSHNVSCWLPLRMRTRPLHTRRITWPVSRGSKTITFLESPTLICLFTLHLRWLCNECN